VKPVFYLSNHPKNLFMVLATKQFNHEIENFHQAMGISDDIRTKCRERIFFSTMSNALQVQELFEDQDDAPKEMRTVTGDLQRCLRMITDPLEYEYTLMVFNNAQRMATETMAYYKHMLESHNNREDRVKMKILELMEEIRGSKDDDDEEDDEAPVDRLNRKTMVKRIKLIKNSHHNFDTYMNMLYKWANGEPNNNSKPDIDDFLRNLFSGNED
jgi:hypothetical protein